MKRFVAALSRALRRLREAAVRRSIARPPLHVELEGPEAPFPDELRDAPAHWLALVRARAPTYISNHAGATRSSPIPPGPPCAAASAPAQSKIPTAVRGTWQPPLPAL